MNDEAHTEHDDADKSEIINLAQHATDVPDQTLEASPGVDELENRLRELQIAMDQIEAGDLDEAERAIELLEDRIASQRD
jgi:uncharacterized protein involved in exopolysaccharide biosynthesis